MGCKRYKQQKEDCVKREAWVYARAFWRMAGVLRGRARLGGSGHGGAGIPQKWSLLTVCPYAQIDGRNIRVYIRK